MRTDPDLRGDERTLLSQFLDYQRATLLLKVEGLTKAQLGRTLPTSSLTLAGLVKHMALVEDLWFRHRFLGLDASDPWASAPFHDDPDWEFHSALDDEPATLVALYETACERSREVVYDAASFDDESVVAHRETGQTYTLRWIMLHMIDETARHNGHADLLREAIDGSTGD